MVGSQPMKQSLQGLLLEWHVHLFAGDLGKQIVGVCGLLLLLLGMTGLLLVPKFRKLKNHLTIRWRSPWQLISYDLHKLGGILSVVFLSLIAFTGAVMIFWTPFEAAVNWLTRTPATPEFVSKVVPGIRSMKLDDILVKAETALPGAKIFKFYPAKEPEATFGVWMQFPLENAFNKDPFLSLDQYTGKVLHVDNQKQGSIATRILRSQYILHIGSYGGLATRSRNRAIGLAPIGLFVTGFPIWWSKTYGAKSKKSQQTKQS
ncbi:PepSY-associated TM helix domain-containing protein [Microcoleus sp. F6_B4]